ncbi:Uncharacterized protein DAT39_013218 [Clarias magur]|uniref:Uncharacterized protein n=1 Tax=Clarias magur TaxID=1594786 RepID=A0A8J4UL05_CLAMG|nr:Uncharacterized protein DAT39_013218 [Clarias magur]
MGETVRLSEGLTERGVFPPGLQVDAEQDTGPAPGSDRSRIAAGKQIMRKDENRNTFLHTGVLDVAVCSGPDGDK